MDIETFKEITIVVQVLTAAFVAFIAVNSYKIARRSLEQTEQRVYLKLYEIVQRHHSKEITDLRGCIYTKNSNSKIAEIVEAASAVHKTMREFDEDFHSKVCTLANYFESLGMFLQYRWEKMPSDAKTMMLAMLHNSVSKTWPEINKYKDAIYPSRRARDWAQSFEWLHGQIETYRREHSL